MTRVIKNALLVCLLAASAFAADNIPTNVPSANPKERNALDSVWLFDIYSSAPRRRQFGTSK